MYEIHRDRLSFHHGEGLGGSHSIVLFTIPEAVS